MKRTAPTLAAKPALKQLTVHDSEREKVWADALDLEHLHVKPNGIACPNCGAELQDGYPVVLQYPPQISVYCAVCGWKGERVA